MTRRTPPRRWFFFFSSRRRHTSLVSDWSSDVCSSDLAGRDADLARAVYARPLVGDQRDHPRGPVAGAGPTAGVPRPHGGALSAPPAAARAGQAAGPVGRRAHPSGPRGPGIPGGGGSRALASGDVAGPRARAEPG